MSEHEAKTDTLYMRVEPSLKQRFEEVAGQYPGTPSAVLRWLLLAFVEGRVTVNPTTQKE